MVNQLLATYGMPLNRRLTISLKPADKGVFDVVLDGKLIFSKHQQGRFPTLEEIKNPLDQKLTMQLEPPAQATTHSA
jgi:selT/selW/selH-like putative selenoprotein